jgi:cytochrome c
MKYLINVTLLAFLLAPCCAAFAGDPAHGKQIYEEECAECHSVVSGKNKKGPTMFQVVGRQSAAIAGFNYSDAMKAKNVVWSPETIAEYTKAPKKFVPGGKMKYDGMDNPQALEDVIAYLSTLK